MLGKTKEELLNSISSYELSEWIVELKERADEEERARKKGAKKKGGR